eukprot:gene5683-7845_t
MDSLLEVKDDITKHVDRFCLPNEEMSDFYKSALKNIFDHQQTISSVGKHKSLIINGVDFETIWEELQLFNKPFVRRYNDYVPKIIKKINTKEESRKVAEEIDDATSNSSNNSEYSDDGNDDSDGNDQSSNLEEDNLNINNINDESDTKDYNKKSSKNKTKSKGVSQENEYDKLEEEMEKWLDNMEEIDQKHSDKLERIEKKMGHRSAIEDANDSDEEDDIDFVQNYLYEDDGDNEDENDASYRYSDFFVDENDEKQGKSKKKKLTSFAGKASLISSHIDDLEQDLMKPKSWELRGEVKGEDRPENSLLELSADIERASKPKQLITQEYTSSIEELIRKRIKDQKFDDLIVSKIADIPKSNEDFELAQEKSSKGLGEIYAEEFLAKSLKSGPDVVSKEIEESRNEALILFEKVSRELDALSRFYYTPKPVVPEMNIANVTANVSSLAFEEATPLFQTTASSLAPEQ